MTPYFSVSENQNIRIITLDTPNSKANILSSPMLMALSDELTQIATKSLDGLIFRTAKPSIFIAGADINEIKDITDPTDAQMKAAEGQRILNQIANLPFPTVAAIQGACLGGGCELALACTYRVASTSSQMGLPEVNLGIIPGFGGTQRLPKLVGLAHALPMILKGKSISARAAVKINLIDRCFSDAFFDDQLSQFIDDVLIRKSVQIKRRTDTWSYRIWNKTLLASIGRFIVIQLAKKTVNKATKGFYQAPIQALKAISYGFNRRLDKGLKREAQLFASLAISPQSKNLIQLFFSNESLRKDIPGITDDVNARNLQSAGVLGAGLMGGGIAWLLSNGNIPVRLKDLNWDAINLSFSELQKIYNGFLNRKKITKTQLLSKLASITGTIDYHGFNKTDIVIEAIIEDIDVKKDVLISLESEVSSTTIIGSNTSALSITEMGSVLKHPERFIGIHFFSPVSRMPLVEIIPGKHTSKETIKSAILLMRQLKKSPVVVNDCPGFLVNRILIPYVNEAVFCLKDGKGIAEIDRIMTQFGMPLGPLSLADEVGIDVGYKVAKILELGYGARMTVCPLFDVFFNQMGLMGKKEKEGFYIHGKRKKRVNPDVNTAIQSHLSLNKGAVSNEDCRNRLILIMVNEAARCIEEGVVDSPELLDIAMVMGTGFPPFRGGLCRYVDAQGVSKVVDQLTYFAETVGDRFTPSEGIIEMGRTNRQYYV